MRIALSSRNGTYCRNRNFNSVGDLAALSLGLGGDMRFLGAALVCIAILYGMDAYFSDGRYFASLQREIADIRQHW